jgi:hypothetical protein
MNAVSVFRQASAKVAQVIAEKTGQTKLKAQPSVLRLFLPLSDSESEYTFNFDQDVQGNISPLARGLQFRNSFQAMAMAIGIMPVKTVSGTLYWGAAAEIYWPDPAVFSGAATSVLTEAEALEGVYQGSLTFQTNEGLRLDNHPTNIFRTVPETTRATITPFSGGTAYNTYNSEFGQQYQSLGGVFNVMGGDDNYIKVKINTKDKSAIKGSATRTNYLVIELLGTEVKGNTTAQLQK